MVQYSTVLQVWFGSTSTLWSYKWWSAVQYITWSESGNMVHYSGSSSSVHYGAVVIQYITLPGWSSVIYTLTMAETHKLLFFPGCYDHVKLDIFFSDFPSFLASQAKTLITPIYITKTMVIILEFFNRLYL